MLKSTFKNFHPLSVMYGNSSVHGIPCTRTINYTYNNFNAKRTAADINNIFKFRVMEEYLRVYVQAGAAQACTGCRETNRQRDKCKAKTLLKFVEKCKIGKYIIYKFVNNVIFINL